MHYSSWGGLIIQTPVNWREGLDNRMSCGTVANRGFHKSLFKVNNNLQPSGPIGSLDMCIYKCFECTCNR